MAAKLGLDWKEHIVVSEALLRPSDISSGKGNPAKAERVLGWKAQAHMREVIARMVKGELEILGRRAGDRPTVGES